MIKLFIVVILQIIYNISMGQNPNIDVLESYIHKCSNFTSLQNEVIFKKKMFHSDDTLVLQASTIFYRVPTDTLFGGYIFLELDSVWYAYDGDFLYEGIVGKGSLSKDSATESPNRYIKSTWVSDLVDNRFLNGSSSLRNFIRNSQNKFSLSDTTINGAGCVGIMLYPPDEGEFVDQRFFIAIDKLNFDIVRRMYSVFFQDNEQFLEWTYSNLQYDYKNLVSGRIEENSASLRVDKSPSNDTMKITYDFHALKGIDFKERFPVLISDIKSKYIVLDFWYTACNPCIKSIPQVNKIANEFKDREVAVLGINLVDNQAISKDRVARFLINNPMNYPTILVDEVLRKDFRGLAYPSIFVLDSKFNVIYNETGYSENLFTDLKEFLNDVLH